MRITGSKVTWEIQDILEFLTAKGAKDAKDAKEGKIKSSPQSI
jgi:hypothetical protein